MSGPARDPSPRRLRAAALLLAAVLASAPLAAFEPDPRYPLPYPPLIAVQAPSVDALEAIARYPHLERLLAAEGGEAWASLPLLKAFPAETFFRMLRRRGARDLAYIALPPVTRPGFLFRARLETPAGAGTLLAEAGLAEADAVVARLRGEVLEIAAAPEVFGRWDALPEGPVGELRWRPSLLEALYRTETGATVWMDAPWAAGVIAYQTGYDLRASLLAAGRTMPPAVRLRFRPEEASLAVRLGVPLPDPAPVPAAKAPAARLPLAEAFPPEAGAVMRIGRWAVGAETAHDLAGGKTLYDAVLGLVRIGGTSAAESTRSTLAALRQLTGLHPRALTACLGDGLAWGAWRESDGAARWAAVAEVRTPHALRRRLARLLAWAAFLGREEGTPLAVRALEADGALWAREVRPEGAGAVAVILDEGVLTIGGDAETVRRVRGAARSLRPAPGGTDWLHLRLRPGPALLAEWAERDPAVGLLLGLLQPEEVRLGREGGELYLEARGGTAPTLLLAHLWRLPSRLAALHRRTPSEALAAAAESRLRLFLEAQQIYRGLKLAAVNGRTGPFAPTLGALVTDRAEDGRPLAEMYNRLYDVAIRDPNGYELPFATVLRALDEGDSIGGYRYRSLVRDPEAAAGGAGGDVGRGEANAAEGWTCAILALPVEAARAPALCILDDGRVFEHPAPETTDAGPPTLPADPLRAGWTLRD